jgi:hypothetical protein
VSFTTAAGPRPSPAQPFSGSNPAGLMTTFYCLRFEAHQPGRAGPRVYIHQEQVGSNIPPGTGFPFRHFLRLAGLRWRYSNSRPHGIPRFVESVTNMYTSPTLGSRFYHRHLVTDGYVIIRKFPRSLGSGIYIVT